MERSESEHTTIHLSQLSGKDLPPELEVSTYFDFASHQSEFQELFERESIVSVLGPLLMLNEYLAEKLKAKKGRLSFMKEVVPPGNTIVTGNIKVYSEGPVEFFPAVLIGPRKGEGNLYLGKDSVITGASFRADKGDIAIGEGSTLGPGSMVVGPSWIGGKNEIRPGSFFRENVMTGNDCVFRCEAKHSMFLDGAQFPHPSYVGDSILGYKSHFGNQATTANITLFNASRDEEDWKPIFLRTGPFRVNTGLHKLGVIMGDHGQAGCGAVFDPGVFLGRSAWVYPLSRVQTGFYAPSAVIKNRPARGDVPNSAVRQ